MEKRLSEDFDKDKIVVKCMLDIYKKALSFEIYGTDLETEFCNLGGKFIPIIGASAGSNIEIKLL